MSTRAVGDDRRAGVPWLLLALALFLPPLVLPACTQVQAGPELAIALELDPDPPSAGDTKFVLVVRTPEGVAIEGAEIRVEATMSHAGMVPEFATCTETEPGRYAGSFEFTMGGDWILIVDVGLPDGRAVEEVLEIPGVATRRSQ